MERNMGEQVNKAFEVYRKASIEKDLAKKELEKTTEFYMRYTQELQQKIEEQRHLITKLEAQLSSSAAHQPVAERPRPSAEWPCQSALRSLAVAGVSVFGAAARAAGDVPQSSTALASRGASPEDRDLVDSLTRLSVKFPPALDCEYDFLNSARERQPAPGKPRPPRSGLPLPFPLAAVTEELATAADHRATPAFGFPTRSPASHCAPPASSPSPSSSSSSSLLESVCGPQQPLWSPVLRELERGAVGVGAGGGDSGDSSPDKCAFCHALVPQDRMNSHLYLHFSHKSEASSN
ncbi:hypothetical protein CRUP_036819 [Coryphaenoides rupestris]|nr:hypothetical protein CRUP_036819 [Coryphaenoides rupestris]